MHGCRSAKPSAPATRQAPYDIDTPQHHQQSALPAIRVCGHPPSLQYLPASPTPRTSHHCQPQTLPPPASPPTAPRQQALPQCGPLPRPTCRTQLEAVDAQSDQCLPHRHLPHAVSWHRTHATTHAVSEAFLYPLMPRPDCSPPATPDRANPVFRDDPLLQQGDQTHPGRLLSNVPHANRGGHNARSTP